MNPRTIRLLRDHNFGWSFLRSDTEALDTLVYVWREPQHQFIDEELDGLRKKFVEDATNLLESIDTHTFVVHGTGATRMSVPSEWEDRIPGRFFEVVKEMNTLSAAAYASYDHLIQRARQKLEA